MIKEIQPKEADLRMVKVTLLVKDYFKGIKDIDDVKQQIASNIMKSRKHRVMIGDVYLGTVKAAVVEEEDLVVTLTLETPSYASLLCDGMEVRISPVGS